ncbi:hypothetical protein E2542_SST16731 [Spatholobus suberectus]|nr:hypothetical protein E2542_SST16731 [Spatholobus suberectus]
MRKGHKTSALQRLTVPELENPLTTSEKAHKLSGAQRFAVSTTAPANGLLHLFSLGNENMWPTTQFFTPSTTPETDPKRSMVPILTADIIKGGDEMRNQDAED